jgi:hypothetical protein
VRIPEGATTFKVVIASGLKDKKQAYLAFEAAKSLFPRNEVEMELWK